MCCISHEVGGGGRQTAFWNLREPGGNFLNFAATRVQEHVETCSAPRQRATGNPPALCLRPLTRSDTLILLRTSIMFAFLVRLQSLLKCILPTYTSLLHHPRGSRHRCGIHAHSIGFRPQHQQLPTPESGGSVHDVAGPPSATRTIMGKPLPHAQPLHTQKPTLHTPAHHFPCLHPCICWLSHQPHLHTTFTPRDPHAHTLTSLTSGASPHICQHQVVQPTTSSRSWIAAMQGTWRRC